MYPNTYQGVVGTRLVRDNTCSDSDGSRRFIKRTSEMHLDDLLHDMILRWIVYQVSVDFKVVEQAKNNSYLRIVYFEEALRGESRTTHLCTGRTLA